jgi:hypothetical protein
MCMPVPMYIPHQRCERKCVMGHPSTRGRNSTIQCHLLYVIYDIMTQSYFCAQQKFSSQDPENQNTNFRRARIMFSFNNIGGEDGGDICNIFDFDEDDDVVGRIQSEWDEDTSTTTKKRKFKAFLTDGNLFAYFSDKLKAIA